MEIQLTTLGVIWLVIGLFAFLLRMESLLLAELILASIFQATAVFQLTLMGHTIPLIPYYWIGSLIVLSLMFRVLSTPFIQMTSTSRQVLLIFVGFAFYVTLSTIILPHFFNDLPVYNPRKGIDTQYHNLSPFRFSVSMIGQLIYLWINIALIVFVSILSNRKNLLVTRFPKYIIWGGSLVVVITFWQLAAHQFHFYFPTHLLYNAEGWKLGYMQKIGINIKRLNATFNEPSNLATFLLGFGAFMLRLWEKQPNKINSFLLTFTVLALLLSTSTTAYVGLGILVLLYGMTFMLKRAIPRKAITSLVIMASISLIFIGSIIKIYPLTTIMETQLEKTKSLSFIHRLAADKRAFEILVDTGGLGVGLGGNRPSSFFTWLLSNTGIIGTAFFFTSLLFLAKAARQQRYRNDERSIEYVMVSAATWGLIGTMIGKVISQPDLMFPPLWIWILFLMAALGRRPKSLMLNIKIYKCIRV